MKFRLQKKIELDNGEIAIWYSVWADSKPLLFTKDEARATKCYEGVKEFYRSHGSIEREAEILSEETIELTPKP
jgi:hypothetical protein